MHDGSNLTSLNRKEPGVVHEAGSLRELRFAYLTFNTDKNAIIIGRHDIASYAAFTPEDAELLQQLQSGLSPQAAAEWYYRQHGEMIDIEDFIQSLQALGFLLEEDEEQIENLAGISPILRWVSHAAFSPVAWGVYALLIGYSCYLISSTPQLIPARSQLFFSPYISVVELGLFFGQIPGVLFHEFYHRLAGIREGIPSRISIGYRAYYLVFETDLTGLWGIKKGSRYLPLLAGMLADLIFFACLTLLAGFLIHSTGILAFIRLFCEALAFSTLLRLLWQFNFYLRTDVYFIIAHFFGCIDLQNTTRRFLQNRFFSLIGHVEKLEDETHWHPQDRTIAPWYAWVYCLGYGINIGMFLFVFMPVLLQALYEVSLHLFQMHDTLSFWDSLTILLLNGLQLGIVICLFLKHLKQRKMTSETSLPLSPE